MAENSNRRHPLSASCHPASVWLYLRFALSYRDVEDRLAERGLDISV
jgi:putative transposase